MKLDQKESDFLFNKIMKIHRTVAITVQGRL